MHAPRRLALSRLFILFGALLVGDIAAQIGRSRIAKLVGPAASGWVMAAAAVTFSVLLVWLYVALVHRMERRDVAEVAPKVRIGLGGILLGLALFSCVFGVLSLLGVAQWHGVSAHADVIPMAATALLAAVAEELAFRGSLFRILEEGLGSMVALIVSAAVFGLLHASNPGATVISTAAIALEAGVLLCSAYGLSRNLWFPIGLHFGWNFTEAGIFGVAVSGGSAGHGIVSLSLVGPDLLTGGAFGPEASLVAVVVCLLLAMLLLGLMIRSGRWVPMKPHRAHAR